MFYRQKFTQTCILIGVLAVLTISSMGQIIAFATTATARDPCKSKMLTTAHENSCDKYYACNSNQTAVKDCPNGLAYMGNRGRFSLFGPCDYDFNVDCSGRPQRSVSGQPELYDCPNGLAFAGRNRGVADGCDYPWRGNYCEGRQLANPPISTEHCDWLYGIFGHETSCTRYWTCWNGTATEQLCIGGLLYNEDTHACDWPENVPGCQKHPLCKDDPNGNVPLGKSCNRYWNCQGGYPRLQRCPAMLVFDKRSLRCVVPPTEDCDVPSTTPQPPEEVEEEDRKPVRSQSPQQQQQRTQPQQQRTQQQQQPEQRPQQQQRVQQSEEFVPSRPVYSSQDARGQQNQQQPGPK